MENLELFTRRTVLSVSELAGRIKKLAERHFDFIWVEGEVSGLRRPGSGHVYFSLKDDKSAIRAVLFRNQASLLRFKLEEGLEVLCQCRVSLYEPRGDLQLVVDAMEPRGAGALALAFEQIKARLEAEGLFEPERKKALPDLPARVAVVTSPTGAAIRDFLNVLHRRFKGVEVAVYPVLVQGDKAAGQMIDALRELAQWAWPEVIVLTRGGGSPEDLWAFNDEKLARAIADCPIPVVSAVGHEVDVSISDLAADLRAPTPSAAAELLVKNQEGLSRRLQGLASRLQLWGDRSLRRKREDLNGLGARLGDPRRDMAGRRIRLDDLLARAASGLRVSLHERGRGLAAARERLGGCRPDQRLAVARGRLGQLGLRLGSAAARDLNSKRAALEGARAALRALGPLSVLSRGYALVTDEAGALVRDSNRVKAGDRLEVRLAKGRLKTVVEETGE